jgi:hypothetical protein
VPNPYAGAPARFYRRLVDTDDYAPACCTATVPITPGVLGSRGNWIWVHSTGRINRTIALPDAAAIVQGIRSSGCGQRDPLPRDYLDVSFTIEAAPPSNTTDGSARVCMSAGAGVSFRNMRSAPFDERACIPSVPSGAPPVLWSLEMRFVVLGTTRVSVVLTKATPLGRAINSG